MVEAHHERRAERVGVGDRDLGAKRRDEVERRVLPPVDLAGAERRGGGGVIGYVEPFDAVDLGDLAAGGPVRRFPARHIIGVPDVDDLVARAELALDEFERARADHLGDLLERIGLGEPLGHDERHQARHFGEGVEQQRERRFEADREVLVGAPLQLGDLGGERLAERIAGHPTLERTGAVAAADPLAVVKFEAVAQGETIEKLVRRDRVVGDHLRPRRELVVERKQGVEHHVAMVSRDVGRGPDRIEDAQIRLGDEAQGLAVGGPGGCAEGPAAKARGTRRRGKFAAGHGAGHADLRCSGIAGDASKNRAAAQPPWIAEVAPAPHLAAMTRLGLDDFDFDLPRALIAAHPCAPRDAARLLLIPAAGEFEHKRVAICRPCCGRATS